MGRTKQVYFNMDMPLKSTRSEIKALALKQFDLNAAAVIRKNAQNVKAEAAYLEMQKIIDEIMFANDADIIKAIENAGKRIAAAFK
ncbi:unnamed protein product [marine sediment metagenome]|uniref:Uncharacterized protein n=1 Tax=marine sediment metagenome TaxID=412755 RepID=X0TZK3_9ZZZZ